MSVEAPTRSIAGGDDGSGRPEFWEDAERQFPALPEGPGKVYELRELGAIGLGVNPHSGAFAEGFRTNRGIPQLVGGAALADTHPEFRLN